MIEFEHIFEFDYRVEDVFQIWADFEAWTIWYPILEKTSYLTSQSRGKGTLRKQNGNKLGEYMFLIEEFTEWRDNEFVSLKIIDSSNRLLKNKLRVDFSFFKISEERCQLRWKLVLSLPSFLKPIVQKRLDSHDDAMRKFERFVHWSFKNKVRTASARLE